MESVDEPVAEPLEEAELVAWDDALELPVADNEPVALAEAVEVAVAHTASPS